MVRFKAQGTQRRFRPKYNGHTFKAVQSTFVLLHPLKCILSQILSGAIEICICSVILWEIPSHFELEDFRFPFLTKNSLIWGVKCEKFNNRKS